MKRRFFLFIEDGINEKQFHTQLHFQQMKMHNLRLQHCCPGKIFFSSFRWAYWWFNKFVFAYSKVWLHSFCNIIAMSICYTQNCIYLILILLCVIFSNHTIRGIHCTTMFIWANQLITFLMNIINNIFSVYS